MTCLLSKTRKNAVKNYKVEIIPNTSEEDIQEGLRILGRIVARKFLAEQKIELADEILEDVEHEQHL